VWTESRRQAVRQLADDIRCGRRDQQQIDGRRQGDCSMSALAPGSN
jgi:hypothetical protein